MDDMKVVLGAKEWLENDEKDSLRIQTLHKGDCPTYGHEETIELLEAFSSSQAAYHLAEVDRLTKELDSWRTRALCWSYAMTEMEKESGIDADRFIGEGLKRGFEEEKNLRAAEQRISELTSANERIRHIASASGHGPCRNGGIGEEGTCPNNCLCEWASDILAILNGGQQ